MEINSFTGNKWVSKFNQNDKNFINLLNKTEEILTIPESILKFYI